MRRIKVEATFGGKPGRFDVLEGSGNMLTVVYTGSRENALSIKRAYLATGEYTDESEEQFREKRECPYCGAELIDDACEECRYSEKQCPHNNAVMQCPEDPITYHCPDCGENFILTGE